MKSMRDLQQKLAERFFLPNAMERWFVWNSRLIYGYTEVGYPI